MSKLITKNDLKAIFEEMVTIDGTDMTNQEVDDFVDSLNVTGINAVDYIVENGTNNSWHYRKWNSGIYEAWRYYLATDLTLTTSSAGTYYGDSRTLTMPSFNNSTSYIVFATNTTSQSSGVYIYNCVATNATTMTINYRAHSSITGANCAGAYLIKGYWK